MPDAALAGHEELPGDADCTICRGAGIVSNPGGFSGRFCECYIREHSAKPKAAPEPGAV